VSDTLAFNEVTFSVKDHAYLHHFTADLNSDTQHKWREEAHKDNFRSYFWMIEQT